MSFCGLIKGISPKMSILCVRVKINKRSFLWLNYHIVNLNFIHLHATLMVCFKENVLLMTIKYYLIIAHLKQIQRRASWLTFVDVVKGVHGTADFMFPPISLDS